MDTGNKKKPVKHENPAHLRQASNPRHLPDIRVDVKLSIQVIDDLNLTNQQREVKRLESSAKLVSLEKQVLLYSSKDPSVQIENNITCMPVWKWLLSTDEVQFLCFDNQPEGGTPNVKTPHLSQSKVTHQSSWNR